MNNEPIEDKIVRHLVLYFSVIGVSSIIQCLSQGSVEPDYILFISAVFLVCTTIKWIIFLLTKKPKIKPEE